MMIDNYDGDYTEHAFFFVARRITLLCPCACMVNRLYSMARIHNSKLYNVAVLACASLLIEVV